MKVTENWIEEGRKPCRGKGYPQRDSAEHEGYAEVLTGKRIIENNNTNINSSKAGLLEEILSSQNLNNAYRQVKRNKGAHGVDGMGVEYLLKHLKDNGEELRKSIREGRYRPKPVRRVEIPKEDRRKRTLGIPTVIDRVVQQATTQVLTPIFEEQFCETSYGFRPRRNAHMALQKCIEYADEGYRYVVDMDLEKFFDKVNQSKMIEIISRTVKDGRVISLIHRCLRAGAEENGEYIKTEQGLAQGGNISPLCSNIMLNELDHELESRGIRYVRYADDVVLFAKSKRAAQRIFEHIVPYIEKKLFLRVNKEKSSVGYIGKIKFLGYGFYPSKMGMKLRVHPESTKKLKAKVKEITARSGGIGYDVLKARLKRYITGWINYFKLADVKKQLMHIDAWLRRRIRAFIWKRWKKVQTKTKMLKKLGFNNNDAYMYARTRKGYWRISGSPFLSKAITNDRLKLAGYVNFTSCYEAVKI